MQVARRNAEQLRRSAEQTRRNTERMRRDAAGTCPDYDYTGYQNAPSYGNHGSAWGGYAQGGQYGYNHGSRDGMHAAYNNGNGWY